MNADPLESLDEALTDAHDFWHACQRNYHEPSLFRRELDALIQAARNVTFRLQSLKHLFPEFDGWYRTWQDSFRGDPHMTWLRDARTTVVKRGGLEASSSARVSLTYSYGAPAGETFTLSAATPTAELVERVVRRVPKQLLGNSLVEIERVWSVPELADEELLTVLADCQLKLAALVLEAHRILDGEPPKATPLEAIGAIAVPECMTNVDEIRTIRINPLTGESYSFQAEPIRAVDDDAGKARVEAYGWSKESVAKFYSPDPFIRAEGLAELSRLVLQRDGYHVSLVSLRGQSGDWSVVGLAPEDRLDKFLLWHRVAEMVREGKKDALVFVGEFWAAPLEKVAPALYPDIQGTLGRREELIVYAEMAGGQSRAWITPFRHRMGRIRMEATLEDAGFKPPFLAPVREVWKSPGAGASAHKTRLVVEPSAGADRLYDRIRAGGLLVPVEGSGVNPDILLELLASPVFVVDEIATVLSLLGREGLEKLATLADLGLAAMPPSFFSEVVMPFAHFESPFPPAWGVAFESRTAEELRADEQSRLFQHTDETWKKILSLADDVAWTMTATMIVEYVPFRPIGSVADWFLAIALDGQGKVLAFNPAGAANALGVGEKRAPGLLHAMLAPALAAIQLSNRGETTVEIVRPQRAARRRYKRQHGVELADYQLVRAMRLRDSASDDDQPS